MYHRKEKGDQPRHVAPDSTSDILHLLESQDPEKVESVLGMISENLYTTKDSKFLNELVDYHLAVKTKLSLDILLTLKDPHDKHLFDKVAELMKFENSRNEGLQIFSNLVYHQPMWLHKIANHRLMNTLLQMLKTDTSPINLMSGIFILVCLLPRIPSKFGQLLSDAFEVFSRLAAWSFKKPSSMPDIYVLHLQIGIYSMFHRLYGLFPCNFLAYLRSYYGGRDCTEDNLKVFTLIIKPMLGRVKLHPLLITASKDTELNANRWKKMDYHDIIVDCASISIDPIEGTQEGLNSKMNATTPGSSRQSFATSDGSQFASFSTQSSMSINPEESLVNDSTSSQNPMWSPSHITMVTPPPAVNNAPLKDDLKVNMYSSQYYTEESTPLDYAVEAKPEVSENGFENSAVDQKLKGLENTFHDPVPCTVQTCSSQQLNSNEIDAPSLSYKKITNSNHDILPAVEAKEDDADKEVSDLTSSAKASNLSGVQVRDDTPFCSTTQNLTDEPSNLPATSISSQSDSLPTANEDSIEEMYNSLQDPDAESFVPSFNRYRVVSLCGQPPDVSRECAKRPKALRSISCPAGLFSDSESNTATATNNGHTCENLVVTCCGSVRTASAFATVLSGKKSQDSISTYENLIPLAIPNVTCSSADTSGFLNSLSPPELLDRYIQLGNVTYLNHLGIPLTSSKSTNWTHFGGKPPPDEVRILHNQIKLLHFQLLFERHRKDIHSERNRSILGRSKRLRMQEDLIEALREQVSLLELDNQNLRTELCNQQKHFDQMKNNAKIMEAELQNKIFKIEQEKIQCLFSNKKLQNLLVTQKEENDEMREGCKKSHSEMEKMRLQLEVFSKELIRYQKVEKDATFLSKQIVLMQELNSHYANKIEEMKANTMPDIGEDLMNCASLIEIKDLKHKLDSRNFIIDASKTKILDLEQLISNMKTKLKEQMQVFEDAKSFNKDEILVREERLADLKKMSIQKDTHILELNKDIESLSEKIKILEKKLSSAKSETLARPPSYSRVNSA